MAAYLEQTYGCIVDLLKDDDINVIDRICNEFVSNLIAGRDSVSVIKLNPPYSLMVDLDKVRLGWGKGAYSNYFFGVIFK